MGEIGSEKVLTYVVPCYNSAEYMDHCIGSLIEGSEGHLDSVEVIIVDDGSSKDNTLEKAKAWEAKYPGVVRAIHQENKGHGGALNTGLDNAHGTYFKVVDSDDWLEVESAKIILELLTLFSQREKPIDLLLANYIYDNIDRGQEVMDYKGILPIGREFTWDEVGRFGLSRYILMHSVFYRTEVLRECGIRLPEHTFYVDNIFVYVPLPYVKTMFYVDLDCYMYFIGREDQSVNEKVMIGRVDQQLKITRIMIDAYRLQQDVKNPKLRKYMENYLLMMMTISSVFSLLSDRPNKYQLKEGIWSYLQEHDPETYPKLRHSIFGYGTNMKTNLGNAFTIFLYRIARAIFKFN
ncbi:MAG: glycosyltransferase family 2 protein [Coriobacteriales bacterium]